MNKKQFIQIKNVTFSYDEGTGQLPSPAINHLSLDIEEGSFVAVLGHNGSGKSTLAKLLNLILTPTSGEIYIDGTRITDPDLSDEDVLNIRKNIGMVFQNPDNQLVATIVEEDVAFGPENLGLEPSEIRRRVNSALETVGMSDFKRHSPHQLSGGQKQRIAIAGIIAMMPKCIVFDESTAMLDPSGRREVMDTILRLNREQNITIIHITHYMNEAMLADRVVVMNEGNLLIDGTPYDVFKNVDLIKSAGLDSPQQFDIIYELRRKGHDIKMPESLKTEDCAKVVYDYYKRTTKD
ncbi:MAG: energy-coupling factor transporter ATPase [Clostridia bacterium]|nr:energy-coupling factor transporter ATPase [Clostridia bacterium]